MSFAIRAMGGVVILIRVVKQNGYESYRQFSRSVADGLENIQLQAFAPSAVSLSTIAK